MQEQGAYLLHLEVRRSLTLRAGALDGVFLPAGRYVYVGSARRGIPARIARHRRLAGQRGGKRHWHIDYLLTHSGIRLIGGTKLPGKRECEVSRRIASRKGVTAPAPGFGATDCRSGCVAHLYRVEGKRTKSLLRLNSGHLINHRENTNRKEN